MGNIAIRREVPFPSGLNIGFVTGCAQIAIDSCLTHMRPPDLENLEFVTWELSVSLVDDNEIRRINKQFRTVNEPTDVLSFPQYEPEDIDEFVSSPAPFGPLILGDIIISLEWIERESKSDFEIMRRSFAWMMVHGILHLFGYDHETIDDDGAMRKEESRILLEMEDFISLIED